MSYDFWFEREKMKRKKKKKQMGPHNNEKTPYFYFSLQPNKVQKMITSNRVEVSTPKLFIPSPHALVVSNEHEQLEGLYTTLSSFFHHLPHHRFHK